MSAERGRTELRLTSDERLLTGVRTAVVFVAARNGLSEDERASMAAAAEEATRAAQSKLAGRGFCTVTIEEFEDRIEIRVEHPIAAKPSENGNEAARSSRRVEVTQGVDRVLYEAYEGNASVTLVKFLSKKPA